MFLFGFNRYIRLVSPYGTISTEPLGFSLWSLLFPFIYPLIKGEWIFGLLMLLLTGGSEYSRFYYIVVIIRILAAFIFNRYHISNLLRKGYMPATAEDEAVLKQSGFDTNGNYSNGYNQSSYSGGYSQSNYSNSNSYSNQSTSSNDSEVEYDEKSWEEEKSEAIDAEYEDN